MKEITLYVIYVLVAAGLAKLAGGTIEHFQTMLIGMILMQTIMIYLKD